MSALLTLLLKVLAWCAVLMIPPWIAAARYGARQRRAGEWDENGPLHPTPPPRDADKDNAAKLFTIGPG